MATSASSCTPSSSLWRGFLACSTRSAALFLLRSDAPGFASKFLSFYGSPNGIAPLGPRSIVVLYVVVSEEVREHEPGVRGALSYAAVGDRVLIGTETRLSFVDLAQFLRILEGAVFVGRPRPRYVRRSWDMSPPQGSFLRVVGHVQQLSPVLSGTSHVDKSSLGGADLLQMRHHVVAEGPDLRVIPLRG